MAERFYVLSEDVLDNFEVDVVYLKLYCRKCERTFGATIYHNRVSAERLICRECQNKELEENSVE